MLKLLKQLLNLVHIKPTGDVGIVVKPSLKVADNLQLQAPINSNNDNRQVIVKQEFNISVMGNINCEESIKTALSLGNNSALIVGENVQKLLSDSGISEKEIQERLSNPEVLSTIAEANKIAYTTNNVAKRKVLADLIYEKIKFDEDEESNTLSLAIKTIESLTESHLKAIAFMYLFRSNYVKNNVKYEDFEDFYNNYIYKLIDIPIDNMRPVGLNMIASGSAVSLSVFATDAAMYLPNYFDKINGHYHTGLPPKYRSIASHLESVWDKLEFGAMFLTPQGEYIAKNYLATVLNLYISENED